MTMTSLPVEVGPGELLVYLDYSTNHTVEAEVCLEFAATIVRFLREGEVGARTVEFIAAGTGSKWFKFDLATGMGAVALLLALDAAARDPASILSRGIAAFDDTANVVELSLKTHDQPVRHIPRQEIAILVNRDAEQRRPSPSKSSQDAASLDASPVKWLGRFINDLRGKTVFQVSENLNFEVDFDPETTPEIRFGLPVGILAQRQAVPGQEGVEVRLFVVAIMWDWQNEWSTTVGRDAPPPDIRIGGYFRELPEGQSTFRSFAAVTFESSHISIEPGDYGERFVLVATFETRFDQGMPILYIGEMINEAEFVRAQQSSVRLA